MTTSPAHFRELRDALPMLPVAKHTHQRRRRHPPSPQAEAAHLQRAPHKRALLVGVSSGDTGAGEALQSNQDVTTIKNVLIECYGYAERNIVILQDNEGASPQLRPTKRNVVGQMRRLVRRARSGDRFFFFYAGHSIQMPCHSDSESDGQDEFMVCEDGRHIKDNVGPPSCFLVQLIDVKPHRRLRRILVDSLPEGAQLVALFDTCHAGTMLDLPHTARIRVKFSVVVMVVSRLRCVVIGIRAQGNTAARRGGPSARGNAGSHSPARGPCMGHSHEPRRNRDCLMTPVPGPHVVSISSTADDEESWEDNGGGPLTRAFVETVREEPNLTYGELATKLRHRIAKGCEKRCIEVDRWARKNNYPEDSDYVKRAKRVQRPQISSLQPLDFDIRLNI